MIGHQIMHKQNLLLEVAMMGMADDGNRGGDNIERYQSVREADRIGYVCKVDV